MLTRREFLAASAAGVACAPLAASAKDVPRKKLAVVTTEWRYHSHAWHMAERFLTGYPIRGRWHQSPFEVVTAYIDQFPDNDLSRGRAKEFGFKITPTIADALRNGKDKLDVDAVLIIGEHGKYERNEIGQMKYPRYEFFKAATDVFKQDGKSVPVFNDKHLSWKWDWAKEMVQISRDLDFAFLAGSSLPVTWRMPSIDLPYGSEVDEVICVAMGGVDSYDFHALEVIQCMAERRKGGEKGVVSMQALRGNSVWDAMDSGSWKAGGWDPKLFKACLTRSQTLAQDKTHNHRYPTPEQMRQWVKAPVAYRFEYADGLKATMLLMNGLVNDFTFGAKIKGEREPLSTLFYLPPNPNVVYSAALMSKAEQTFLTGKAAYPVERTLLTSGLVEAGMQSLSKNGDTLQTPHLDVRYKVDEKSTYWLS